MIIESPNVVAERATAPARPLPPLVPPEMCAAVLRVVADIARAAPSHVRRLEDGSLDVALGGGAAGVAVFLHYAANALDDANLHAASVDQLAHALDGLHRVTHPALFGGYSGVAWAVSHLQQRGVDELDEVDLSAVDAALEALLRRVPWTGDYDLISGLVGLGVYGLERVHQGVGDGVAALAVDRLAERAEWMGEELATWFHPPWQVPPMYRKEFPEGWYNLGLAHGVPGVLAFLAGAAHYDVRRAKATRLLAAGARWMCRQVQVDRPERVRIGYRVDPRAPHAPFTTARDAWCYGSPGVAVALLRAACVLGDEALAGGALNLARTTARHDFGESGVFDASFCHGSSGLAHLYARLHAATGDATFAEAARRWTDHTLAFRTPGEGVAGFSYVSSSNGDKVWAAECNFLEGAAGVGLVLLAMLSAEPPSWDRVLLADLSFAADVASG